MSSLLQPCRARRQSRELVSYSILFCLVARVLAFDASAFLGENFGRLAFHSSVVTGNTLYIDGGEQNYKVNGSQNNSIIMNYTLSIDLSQSWTNSTVEIKAILKSNDAPILNYQSSWPDPDNSSFYIFGGMHSFRDMGNVPSPDIWQFKDQSWTKVEGHDTHAPSLTQVRPSGGASSFGNGVGYMLGGYQGFDSPGTGPEWPLPGLVSYDMASNTWNNDSSIGNESFPGISPFGTLINGRMEFVPRFGSEGLLVAMGGEITGPQWWEEPAENFQSLAEISVYDIGSKTWFKQNATGANGPKDIPPPVSTFCIVGASSPQGTFEIFVYGGFDDGYVLANGLPTAAENQRQAQFNKVYILSLPGFVWFMANDTSAPPRTEHTCERVANRQMLSIGGLDSSVNIFNAPMQPDPWYQGLGVFDMVELEWTDGYDANAPPYTLPGPIQDWYNQPNSYSSTQWSDSALRSLFSSSTNNNNTSNSSSTETTLSPASRSSGPSAGTIAGAVVGSLAGTALLAALIAVFIRRRKYRAKGPPLSGAEMDIKTPPHDLRNFVPRQELVGESRPGELDTKAAPQYLTELASPDPRFGEYGGRFEREVEPRVQWLQR